MDSITYSFTFSVNFFCKFGYSVYLVGDLPILGAWNPAHAIKLTWNEVTLNTSNNRFSNFHCRATTGQLAFKFLAIKTSKSSNTNISRP